MLPSLALLSPFAIILSFFVANVSMVFFNVVMVLLFDSSLQYYDGAEHV
jgi:hypothetical protein